MPNMHINSPPFVAGNFTNYDNWWTITSPTADSFGDGGAHHDLTVDTIPIDGLAITMTFDFMDNGGSHLSSANPWGFCGAFLGTNIAGEMDPANPFAYGFGHALLPVFTQNFLRMSFCTDGFTAFTSGNLTIGHDYPGNTISMTAGPLKGNGKWDVTFAYNNPDAALTYSNTNVDFFDSATDTVCKLYITVPCSTNPSFFNLTQLAINNFGLPTLTTFAWPFGSMG